MQPTNLLNVKISFQIIRSNKRSNKINNKRNNKRNSKRNNERSEKGNNKSINERITASKIFLKGSLNDIYLPLKNELEFKNEHSED